MLIIKHLTVAIDLNNMDGEKNTMEVNGAHWHSSKHLLLCS